MGSGSGGVYGRGLEVVQVQIWWGLGWWGQEVTSMGGGGLGDGILGIGSRLEGT